MTCHFLHWLTLHTQIRLPDTVPRGFSNAFLSVTFFVVTPGTISYPPSFPKYTLPLWSIYRIPRSVVPPPATNMYSVCPSSTFPMCYLLCSFNVEWLQTCYVGHR